MEKELLEITSRPKWWAVTSVQKEQIWLINTARRIEHGNVTVSTLVKFFGFFNIKIELCKSEV